MGLPLPAGQRSPSAQQQPSWCSSSAPTPPSRGQWMWSPCWCRSYSSRAGRPAPCTCVVSSSGGLVRLVSGLKQHTGVWVAATCRKVPSQRVGSVCSRRTLPGLLCDWLVQHRAACQQPSACNASRHVPPYRLPLSPCLSVWRSHSACLASR